MGIRKFRIGLEQYFDLKPFHADPEELVLCDDRLDRFGWIHLAGRLSLRNWNLARSMSNFERQRARYSNYLHDAVPLEKRGRLKVQCCKVRLLTRMSESWKYR